jgi:hypothetical protein
MNERIDEPVAHLGCAECGANGGYALYCVRCAEKFVGGKEWVGLTEDEIKECFKITPDQFLSWQIYIKIEAKLKDKNT